MVLPVRTVGGVEQRFESCDGFEADGKTDVVGLPLAVLEGAAKVDVYASLAGDGVDASLAGGVGGRCGGLVGLGMP